MCIYKVHSLRRTVFIPIDPHRLSSRIAEPVLTYKSLTLVQVANSVAMPDTFLITGASRGLGVR